MKKHIILCLTLLLSACSLFNSYDKEFKNPIFYQPMRPLSTRTGWTYLTPTSVNFRTPLDKNKINSTGKCDLIENEQDKITLKCKIFRRDGYVTTEYLTYVITDLYLFDRLRIEERIDGGGTYSLSVTPHYLISPTHH